MTKNQKDVYMYALGALIVIGFFVLVIYKMYKNLDAQLEIGALLAAFGAVVGYFYGSSKGSADKNELINKQ